MSRYYRRDWRGRFANGGGSGRPGGGRQGSIRAVGGAKAAGGVQRRGATRWKGGSKIKGNKNRRFVSVSEAGVGAIPGAIRYISPVGSYATVGTRLRSYAGARRLTNGRSANKGYIVSSRPGTK